LRHGVFVLRRRLPGGRLRLLLLLTVIADHRDDRVGLPHDELAVELATECLVGLVLLGVCPALPASSATRR
jgi:hypothetical protein